MSDHRHGKVHLLKPCGVEEEDEEPPSPADPPCSITTPGPGASTPSNISKPRRRSCSKPDPDTGLGPVSAGPAVKNLKSPDCDQTLDIKGTGKTQQGKSEPNGNYVTLQEPRGVQEARCQDGSRKRRPVTVDTSKAKTSLEALKLSIKQLKWKEVRQHPQLLCVRQQTVRSEVICGPNLLFCTR